MWARCSSLESVKMMVPKVVPKLMVMSKPAPVIRWSKAPVDHPCTDPSITGSLVLNCLTVVSPDPVMSTSGHARAMTHWEALKFSPQRSALQSPTRPRGARERRHYYYHVLLRALPGY